MRPHLPVSGADGVDLEVVRVRLRRSFSEAALACQEPRFRFRSLSCLRCRRRWRVDGGICGTAVRGCQGAIHAHRAIVERKRLSRMPYKRC